MHYTRLALGLKFPHRRAFVQRLQGGPCWSPGIPVLQRNPNCSLCRGLPPGTIGAIVGIRARPDPVAGRRLVHQRVEPISVPRAEAVQYPVVCPVGCQRSGLGCWPAVITGRTWSRRVAAVAVCDLPAGPQAVLCRVARPAQGDRAPCAAPRGRRPGPTSTSSS